MKIDSIRSKQNICIVSSRDFRDNTVRRGSRQRKKIIELENFSTDDEHPKKQTNIRKKKTDENRAPLDSKVRLVGQSFTSFLLVSDKFPLGITWTYVDSLSFKWKTCTFTQSQSLSFFQSALVFFLYFHFRLGNICRWSRWMS